MWSWDMIPIMVLKIAIYEKAYIQNLETLCTWFVIITFRKTWAGWFKTRSSVEICCWWYDVWLYIAWATGYTSISSGIWLAWLNGMTWNSDMCYFICVYRYIQHFFSYNDFSWAGEIRSIYNVLTCQRTPGSDFMGAKILDIYNVLIGHGIPGNGKSLETLKLEVSTGVWFHVRGLGHDQTEVNQSAPWSETVMRRQIHIFDEFVLSLMWIVDIFLSSTCSIWAEKLHWLDTFFYTVTDRNI